MNQLYLCPGMRLRIMRPGDGGRFCPHPHPASPAPMNARISRFFYGRWSQCDQIKWSQCGQIKKTERESKLKMGRLYILQKNKTTSTWMLFGFEMTGQVTKEYLLRVYTRTGKKLASRSFSKVHKICWSRIKMNSDSHIPRTGFL